jgi:hypothetical protein
MNPGMKTPESSYMSAARRLSADLILYHRKRGFPCFSLDIDDQLLRDGNSELTLGGIDSRLAIDLLRFAAEAGLECRYDEQSAGRHGDLIFSAPREEKLDALGEVLKTAKMRSRNGAERGQDKRSGTWLR